ncbi:uncharacterized protein LOC133010887 isoform X1 [Limanda limanda]|uniref:uncharacterized protein LOC132998922 isoform X1 n=1 Tax=Limanda limanda TaxID=27771 RepID=UPI0029C81611|nr:uncharacterized protein LOC132998922 isoform X1 [Limanda limanda]XP_060934520.1 uncharacterized protein LOC133010887 isoform X1 [Limanda limanda]
MILDSHNITPEAPRAVEEPCSSQTINDSVVVSSFKKKGGKGVYDKKHYCLYCSKPISKIARHLERAHEDKSDVAKALSFPKGSKEKKRHLDYIGNRGNFAHNAAVMEYGKGKLVPRPPKGLDEIGIDPNEPHTEETFPHTERDEMLPQPPKRQNPHSSSDEVPSESCRMRPSSIAPPAEESLPPTERNEMQPQPPNKPKPVSTMRPSSKGTTAQKKKTPWKQTEVEAVESHMNRFITSCIVPAKFDCEKCIRAEPEALNDRSWQNVKFYIYNRITANKRKFSK